MAVKTVRLEDFAKTLEVDGKQRTEDFRKAVVRGAMRSIPDLVENSPVDTGLYAASWRFEPKEWGAIIGNFAPHAAIIEEGARPFTPPMGPLLAWAKRVLKDPSTPPNYSSEVWALAKGTQLKIQKYGMKPKHILQKQIPEILDNIKDEYERLQK
jgi:hypothetical protein